MVGLVFQIEIQFEIMEQHLLGIEFHFIFRESVISLVHIIGIARCCN